MLVLLFLMGSWRWYLPDRYPAPPPVSLGDDILKDRSHTVHSATHSCVRSQHIKRLLTLRSNEYLGKHSHPGIPLSSQWALTFPPEDYYTDRSAHLNRWKWRAIGWEKSNFFQAEWLSVPGLGRVKRMGRRCRAGGASSTPSIVSSALIRALLAPKNNITCLPIKETDKSWQIVYAW